MPPNLSLGSRLTPVLEELSLGPRATEPRVLVATLTLPFTGSVSDSRIYLSCRSLIMYVATTTYILHLKIESEDVIHEYIASNI